jgi:hypothetical protein
MTCRTKLRNLAYHSRLVIAAILLSNVWTGCIDPKMGATIFNNIDENKLATTFGGIVTYFQIGDIVSRVFFAGLVLVFEVKVISLIYIVLCIYALILLFKNNAGTVGAM